MVRRLAIIYLCDEFFHVGKVKSSDLLASFPRASRIHLLIIKRCKCSNQRYFKTHRARDKIARKNPPCALATTHILDSGVKVCVSSLGAELVAHCKCSFASPLHELQSFSGIAGTVVSTARASTL